MLHSWLSILFRLVPVTRATAADEELVVNQRSRDTATRRTAQVVCAAWNFDSGGNSLPPAITSEDPESVLDVKHSGIHTLEVTVHV